MPAALIGAPIHALLERATAAEQACAHFDSTETNSGLWLGLALGELARRGRDKLTFVVGEPDRRASACGSSSWSPRAPASRAAGSCPSPTSRCASPRPTATTACSSTCATARRAAEELDEDVEALAAAGQPTITLTIDGAEDLGRMFFLAEFATAVAGWVLEINPFDQPNVQEAKDATKRVLAAGLAAPSSSRRSDAVAA